MLTPYFQQHRLSTRSGQKGVVLLITLIMLVAMTLAAIALVRSVDTTNLIAGNLAFQQSSTHTADFGTEQAIDFLYTVKVNCDATGAGANACPAGYKSFYEPGLEPPTNGRTWELYWDSLKAAPGVRPLANLPAGYSGAFVIEAICTATMRVGCSILSTSTTVTTPQGQDMGSTQRTFKNTAVSTDMGYFRITTRIEGPRNSVSFVQSLVAFAVL